jgi:hypothetical protein
MHRPRSVGKTGASDGGGAVLFYSLAAAFAMLWAVIALYLPQRP